MAAGDASLEHTPSWAISIVCLCFFIISFILEASLRCLTEFLRKRKRKSLVRAFEKIETEMITMGFVSLLLTITEVPISKICVNEALANSFHPCKDIGSEEHTAPSVTQIPGYPPDSVGEIYCRGKGLVSLISREGVVQLKMFISILAVFHVIYCTSTMFLGMAKMKGWKTWEEETKSLDYQIANDPRRFRLIRQTSFGRRHLKMWSDHTFLLWPVCFFRQFCGSASKADYFTLRNGFILANVAEGSTFNFQKFLARAYDDDFEQVVGIRLWIWMLCLLFILCSAQEFYNYYWLPFIPLLLLLAVGTKLETIITKMCKERSKNTSVIQGTFLVKPSDEFFWFNHPKLLLYLLQLILIQNSFQLAFFTWAWYQYGLRSCFNRETEDVAIIISTGLVVQFLCGYVTLPIYALVTRMGSNVTKAVLTERVIRGLKNWQMKARRNRSNNESTTTSFLAIMGSSTPETEGDSEVNDRDHTIARAEPITRTPETSIEEASFRVFSRVCDDEISFGSSWKKLESSGVSGEISSIIEGKEEEEEEEEDDDYDHDFKPRS